MGLGRNKLWSWFGLSYAGYLVLPRVQMHEMPDEWQSRMADLLDEYSDSWEGSPLLDGGDTFQVTVKKDGQFHKQDRNLRNYRYPDPRVLKAYIGKENDQ